MVFPNDPNETTLKSDRLHIEDKICIEQEIKFCNSDKYLLCMKNVSITRCKRTNMLLGKRCGQQVCLGKRCQS